MRGRWVLRIFEIRGHSGRCRSCLRIRGHAFVELRDAAAVRIPFHHVLASEFALVILGKLLFGGLPSGPRRHALAETHDGTLGTDDARTTREIPRRDARRLRPRSARTEKAEPKA